MLKLTLFVIIICLVMVYVGRAQTLLGSEEKDFYLYPQVEYIHNKVLFTGGFVTPKGQEITHFLGRCDTRTYVVIDTYRQIGPRILYVGKGANKIQQAYTKSALWLAFDILCGKLEVTKYD